MMATVYKGIIAIFIVTSPLVQTAMAAAAPTMAGNNTTTSATISDTANGGGNKSALSLHQRLAPTCIPGVCFAFDTSGSICSTDKEEPRLCTECKKEEDARHGSLNTGDLCCKNYKKAIEFAKKLATDLDDLPLGSRYYAVKFGTEAETISTGTTDLAAFVDTIEDSSYSGGYTNTEQGISKCAEMLKGEDCGFIVLLSDGTTTACNKATDTSSVQHCPQDSKCDLDCDYSDGRNQYKAATKAANRLKWDRISLIPVLVKSVSIQKKKMRRLARCPENKNKPCRKYYNLKAWRASALEKIADEIRACATCEPVESEDPTQQPSTAYPSTSPSKQPNIASPSASPSADGASVSPSAEPSGQPFGSPSAEPSAISSGDQSSGRPSVCSAAPSMVLSSEPSATLAGRLDKCETEMAKIAVDLSVDVYEGTFNGDNVRPDQLGFYLTEDDAALTAKVTGKFCDICAVAFRGQHWMAVIGLRTLT